MNCHLLLIVCSIFAFALMTDDLANIDMLSIALVIAFLIEYVSFYLYKRTETVRVQKVLAIGLSMMLGIGVIMCFGIFDVLYHNASYYENNFSVIYSLGIVVLSAVQIYSLHLSE